MRSFPIIVNVPKVDGVKVLHISRENCGNLGMGARTECGRELNYVETCTLPAEHFRNADGLMVEPEYDFQGSYKVCSRCGTTEEFAEAMEEYVKGMLERKLHYDKLRAAKEESISKMMCAIRATIIATLLPEGAEDIENDDWGITFAVNGTRYQLRPDDEECQRLHNAAEEAVCISS
jgi:hypothetical protein